MPQTADPIRLNMIRYRAWHRGFREADLILGGFADRHLGDLSPAELDAFEALLEHPDQLLYAWIVGQQPPPPDVPGAVFSRLQQYRVAAEGDPSSNA